VSAQIITALRKRARDLDAEAEGLEAQGVGELEGAHRSVRELRLLACEFRALAKAAEAP
jgi:hypothetical protein